MKITKDTLKRIIKEELSHIEEAVRRPTNNMKLVITYDLQERQITAKLSGKEVPPSEAFEKIKDSIMYNFMSLAATTRNQ